MIILFINQNVLITLAYIGAGLFILSFIYLIVSIVLTAVGIMSYFNIIFSAVFLVLSLILIFMGITGMYLARIYDEAKGRPNYILDERKRK